MKLTERLDDAGRLDIATSMLAALGFFAGATAACFALLEEGRQWAVIPFAVFALFCAVYAVQYAFYALLATWHAAMREPGSASASASAEDKPEPESEPPPAEPDHAELRDLDATELRYYQYLAFFLGQVVERRLLSQPAWWKAHRWPASSYNEYMSELQSAFIVEPPKGQGAGRGLLVGDLEGAWALLDEYEGFDVRGSLLKSRRITITAAGKQIGNSPIAVRRAAS